MSRLDEIKARADAATEGPWVRDMHSPDMSGRSGWYIRGPRKLGLRSMVLNSRMLSGDAEFVEAAREDVPWLVDQVESLERWKFEACEVMSGLRELGKALGLRPRVQITGLAALAEVDRLTEEYDAILTRQSDLLTRTVNALRGNPPPLTSWSHHDIPKLAAEKVAEVARLTAERDALIAVGKRQAARLARVESLAEEWSAELDENRCPAHAFPRCDCHEGYHHAWGDLRAALSGPEADTSAQETEHRCEPYYSRSECGQCGWQEQWCVTCSRQMCGCATDAMGADQ